VARLFPRRRLALLSLLLGALGVAFAVSYALRDVTPPQLYVEAPERAEVGEVVGLFVSADEPVTFEVVYGDTAFTEVAQGVTVPLTILRGEGVITIAATDGAGNRTEVTRTLYGMPPLTPTLSLPERVAPGQPFSLLVAWDEDGAEVTSLLVRVAGETRRVFREGASAVALAGVPLGTPPGAWPVVASVTDRYGRTVTLPRTLEVGEHPLPVQELNVAASVLAVVTPEGQRQEAEVMAAAYGKSAETPQPLWTDAFMVPIEGRATSGFGVPRRYRAGGNVSYHYGADIAAPVGTKVRAANRGRVLVAEFLPIKGGFVALDHGAGVYSLYLHQSRLLVAPGQVVERGEAIGEVGSTGLSTGPHLHWEMRVLGEATDPLAWVGRLLP
jgi:hypothetical protein